ncbi:MAG: hypothetical protein U9Q33_02950 [Campylobacterota bacterium]|nr:hypothetical protein [Campylobacterota bacterium]
MKKATTIDEIYSVFAPEKFLKHGDEEFYVPLYEDDLKRFVNALMKNEVPTKSFFIAGQSGNGKSTILNLLTTKYTKLESKYDFLYISGKEIFDYENIDIIDILLMIGNRLVLGDKDLEENYIEKLKKLEDVKNGSLEVVESTSSSADEQIQASAFLKAKARFFSMLSVGAEFTSSYRLNDTMREDARKIFKIKKRELIKLLNELITDYKVTKNLSQDILIVIDDLEKKENTDKLFLEDLRSLDEINLTKIITMPIHLRRTQTFNDKDIREFALKLNDFQGNENSNDKDLLSDVVERRIANKELIEDDVIKEAIEYSGGNLRQLIKLIHFAAEEASTFEEKKISMKELDYSIEHLQRNLSSAIMMMKNFLKEILDNKMPKDDTKESLENLGKAIKMGLVFAYFNGKIWYEVNPLVVKVLKSYLKIEDEKLPN